MAEWSFSNCSACVEMGCCTEYMVTIIGRDAYLIAGHLRLPIWSFTYTTQQKEPTAGGFILQADGPAQQFALNKREEGSKDGHSPCAFLMDLPEGHHRCSIYEFRPHVCRTYPATYLRGTVRFRRTTKCPGNFYDIGKVDLRRWQPMILDMRVEDDIYTHLVRLWNNRVQAQPQRVFEPREFYGFLVDFYHRTERLRPSRPEGWIHLREAWCERLEQGRSPIDDPDEDAGTTPGEKLMAHLAGGLRTLIAQLTLPLPPGAHPWVEPTGRPPAAEEAGPAGEAGAEESANAAADEHEHEPTPDEHAHEPTPDEHEHEPTPDEHEHERPAGHTP